MKKTLSILALAALAVGISMGEEVEKVITVYPEFPLDSEGRYEVPSNQYGAKIAPGATLVDSSTGGVVTYDEADEIDVIKAPFDIDEGLAYTTLTLDLSDLVLGEATKLILDFTTVSGKYQPQNWGLYLQAGYTFDYIEETVGNEDIDYLFISIKGVDFGQWYEENRPVEVIGRFSAGTGSIFETTAFVITEACDASSEGGITFFSEDVIDDVKDSEVIPEPTTATLSLLALAGLVARRRRK